ncbi:MarR family winged helix-turn-helix transcriptional regulator [Clostridium sp. DL1XJH146]
MFNVESCVVFITNKVAKKLGDSFNEKLVSEGSTRVQWLVMYNLNIFDKINQRELADKMDLKASTIVRLIDRMEKEELVERTKDNEDRRVTYLSLTEKGQERIKKLMPIAEEVSLVFSKGISKEEFQVFYKVLDIMAKNADEDTN